MEILSGIYYRLNAGVRVVMVKKLDRPDDPIKIDRPDWVRSVDDALVVSPAEAFGMFRKG